PGGLDGGDGRQQYRELVATDPRDGVVVTQYRPEPMAGLDEYLVAGMMSERVVDAFEAVQVDQHDGQMSARIVVGRLQRGSQATFEQRTVGESGQWVVQGQVLVGGGMFEYASLVAEHRPPDHRHERQAEREPEAGGGQDPRLDPAETGHELLRLVMVGPRYPVDVLLERVVGGCDLEPVVLNGQRIPIGHQFDQLVRGR